jgi:hypothetical protein
MVTSPMVLKAESPLPPLPPEPPVPVAVAPGLRTLTAVASPPSPPAPPAPPVELSVKLTVWANAWFAAELVLLQRQVLQLRLQPLGRLFLNSLTSTKEH